MRPADLHHVAGALLRLHGRGIGPRLVTVFSPYADLSGRPISLSERTVIEAEWPQAGIQELDRCQWDLDDVMPDGIRHAEVGVICNTFMCSRDPGRWLRHISKAVDILVIQDLSVCDRGGDGGRGCIIENGDIARYSVSSHGIIGATDPGLEVFDLSIAGYGLLDVVWYEDGESRKFVAVLRLR